MNIYLYNSKSYWKFSVSVKFLPLVVEIGNPPKKDTFLPFFF